MNEYYSPDALTVNNGNLETIIANVSMLIGGFAIFFLIASVLVAFSLWRAARNGHTGWFIALFLFGQTLILPLIYILIYRPEKQS